MNKSRYFYENILLLPIFKMFNYLMNYFYHHSHPPPPTSNPTLYLHRYYDSH